MRRSQTAATGNQHQPKPRVEFTAVVRSAAGQARHGTACAVDARKFLAAIWAPIHETRRVSFRREREIVAALFIRDSQIAASLPPLGAMGQDAPPTGAKLSEDMREFMAQSAIDFRRMLKQPGI